MNRYQIRFSQSEGMYYVYDSEAMYQPALSWHFREYDALMKARDMNEAECWSY